MSLLGPAEATTLLLSKRTGTIHSRLSFRARVPGPMLQLAACLLICSGLLLTWEAQLDLANILHASHFAD
jgi:hypothetical protein